MKLVEKGIKDRMADEVDSYLLVNGDLKKLSHISLNMKEAGEWLDSLDWPNNPVSIRWQPTLAPFIYRQAKGNGQFNVYTIPVKYEGEE